MKTLPAAILTALILFGCSLHKEPVVVNTTTVTTVADRIIPSIVRIEGTLITGRWWVCTGFSIAPRKYVTAAHCTVPLRLLWGSVLKVNNRLAIVTKEDPVNDLALVVVDLVKPSVTFRTSQLKFMEDVEAVGYALGFYQPVVTAQKAMLINYVSDSGAIGTIYRNPFIMGMSGGPIYDNNGDVVGVIQKGVDYLSYGVNSATVVEFIKGE